MPIALWLGLLGANLVLPGAPSPVSWSPDGRWLAYVQEIRPVRLPITPGWLFRVEAKEAVVDRAVLDATRPASLYRLWATKPDTGESVMLAESRGPLTSACWSRDGTGLAFGRLVRGSDSTAQWETVIQDSPDRQRVVHREPVTGPEPSADKIQTLTLAWSPDGRILAAPKLQPPGLLLLRATDGRVERSLDGALHPRWAPNDSRLAYVQAGRERGVYLLDIRQESRRLTDFAPESDRLPAPVWSRDGQSLLILRRTLGSPSPDQKGTRSELQLVKSRADNGQTELAVNLVHDPIGREGTLLGSWFTLDPDGDDLFYATAMPDQRQAQITWSYQARPEEVHKRLNPYDESGILAALAACPGSRGLAFRVGERGIWSPPAVCDPDSERVLLLAPDDASRMEWVGRLLETMLLILRDQLPDPALVDGTPVERPSLLPSPGELEPGDPIWLRLGRLSRMGLQIVGPSSPDKDELRLAFAYFARDYPAAIASVESLLTRADSADQRLRLLSVRAQIDLMRRDFDHARPLIDYLAKASVGPSHEIVETVARPRLRKLSDPRSGWPGFLSQKLDALKKPVIEQPEEPAARNVLELNGARPQEIVAPGAPF
ncbi:MAG: periplasmic component of the Tol biopolymer transport system [Planctomycetota bacterium]|nr:periplasmic component of the Tol biopolymer transport system [Planctomycetota bacterium]